MLSDYLRAARQSSILFPEGWGQGRAVYGGLVAGVMMAHLQATVAEGLPARSMSLSFVGPVEPGPAEFNTQILRRGKSVLHVLCQVVQGGEVRCAMLAAFGNRRASDIIVSAEIMPRSPEPETCVAMPYVPGVMPEFTEKFEYRWVDGAMPFTGADKGILGGWLRLNGDTGVADVALLLALIDAWPPAVLPMYSRPAPASSMTWTVDFLASDDVLGSPAWWRYRSEAQAAHEGYAFTSAKMWADDGRLVALSRQAVTIFA